MPFRDPRTAAGDGRNLYPGANTILNFLENFQSNLFLKCKKTNRYSLVEIRHHENKT